MHYWPNSRVKTQRCVVVTSMSIFIYKANEIQHILSGMYLLLWIPSWTNDIFYFRKKKRKKKHRFYNSLISQNYFLKSEISFLYNMIFFSLAGGYFLFYFDFCFYWFILWKTNNFVLNSYFYSIQKFNALLLSLLWII